MSKKRTWFRLAAAALVAGAGLYGTAKLAIRHEQIPLVDSARNNRDVPVDVYVRRDKEAMAAIAPLPVVVISHGNTVKSYEYSFAANALASRGYLVLSVQHDIPGDPPLANEKDQPYRGRMPSYERGSANIDFVVNTFKKLEPFADYKHLTLLGHSQGGDISVFYASTHPDTVTQVITWDNLRMELGKALIGKVPKKILSIRGNNKDGFEPDPGVVPDCDTKAAADSDTCEKDGITIYNSRDHHTNLNDRGPEALKKRLNEIISRFLDKKPVP